MIKRIERFCIKLCKEKLVKNFLILISYIFLRFIFFWHSLCLLLGMTLKFKNTIRERHRRVLERLMEASGAVSKHPATLWVWHELNRLALDTVPFCQFAEEIGITELPFEVREALKKIKQMLFLLEVLESGDTHFTPRLLLINDLTELKRLLVSSVRS